MNKIKIIKTRDYRPWPGLYYWLLLDAKGREITRSPDEWTHRSTAVRNARSVLRAMRRAEIVE